MGWCGGWLVGWRGWSGWVVGWRGRSGRLGVRSSGCHREEVREEPRHPASLRTRALRFHRARATGPFASPGAALDGPLRTIDAKVPLAPAMCEVRVPSLRTS
ncbi:hypothetical protein CU254_07490 [Amycolatopsis sp. AA4]|nr:hypothetical protein CU254_07490 [Amycolatopsis sp. AA4]